MVKSGTDKRYLAIFCWQTPRSTNPLAIFQTASRRGLLGNPGGYSIIEEPGFSNPRRKVRLGFV